MIKNLKNMRIGTRLSMAFALVLALVIVLTVVGVARLQGISQTTIEMDAAMRKMRLSEQWKGVIAANNSLTEARLRTTDVNDDAMLAARMKDRSAEVTKIQDELGPLLKTEHGKHLFGMTGLKRREYTDIRNQVFAFKENPAKDQAAFNALVKDKLLPAIAAYERSVEDVIKWQEKMLADAKDQVETAVISGKLVLIVCGSVALALGVILSWLLTRSITIPLHKAVAVARKVADGDLTVAAEATSGDETGQLIAALQDMTENLNRIVGSVRASSDTIASAATQVASGNLDLSARTEQQASSIEETAASIEELSTTVQNNAANARQGNQVATSASDIATKGGVVVAQVVQTMAEINESSKKIVDIISVIDGIAFQTNILALNAAVEAARAGEQGRGFAVVAGEVRTLAQRSAAAAKEIKGLIDNSVDKVAAGRMLVNEAGRTIGDVVESVKRVTGIMSEIATASQEQSEGIQQVNAAIRQMDQVTQQNAALVEEAAAATESMRTQAHQLTEAVGVFKLYREVVQYSTAVPLGPVKVSPSKPVKRAMATARPAKSAHRSSLSKAEASVQ